MCLGGARELAGLWCFWFSQRFKARLVSEDDLSGKVRCLRLALLWTVWQARSRSAVPPSTLLSLQVCAVVPQPDGGLICVQLNAAHVRRNLSPAQLVCFGDECSSCSRQLTIPASIVTLVSPGALLDGLGTGEAVSPTWAFSLVACSSREALCAGVVLP